LLQAIINSPTAQTIVIADLNLRQALLTKTLSIAAQMDVVWATGGQSLTIITTNF
jgi:hypothetical protein